MPATVEELFDAYDEIMGSRPSADILYLVRDAADEAEVRAAASGQTPFVYNSMPRRSTRIEERVNETTWKIRVHYEPRSYSPATDSFTFDITGGTQHITQSIATVGRYAAPGFVAPDLEGAIGFDGERITGVDINVPVFSFSETHYKDAGEVDFAYKAALFNLCSATNNTSFRGFAAGTCLFVGASGSQKEGGQWEITYRFSASPNRANIAIGQITGIAKLGWHYLWVLYADDQSEGFVVKRPVAVYVEQVYEEGDFSVLGI